MSSKKCKSLARARRLQGIIYYLPFDYFWALANKFLLTFPTAEDFVGQTDQASSAFWTMIGEVPGFFLFYFFTRFFLFWYPDRFNIPPFWWPHIHLKPLYLPLFIITAYLTPHLIPLRQIYPPAYRPPIIYLILPLLHFIPSPWTKTFSLNYIYPVLFVKLFLPTYGQLYPTFTEFILGRERTSNVNYLWYPALWIYICIQHFCEIAMKSLQNVR